MHVRLCANDGMQLCRQLRIQQRGGVISQNHAAPLLGCESSKEAMGVGITLCGACLLHTWSSSRLGGTLLHWQHLWIW